MNFFPLKVVEKSHPTDSSVYLTLKVPLSLQKEFLYKSGQYVSIRIEDINGIYQNRAYSICGPIKDSNISICIKKVPDGLVSSYLNDTIKLGDDLYTSFPKGDFTLAKSNPKTENIIFISAGSGITPIKSQIDLLLFKNHTKNIFLIYGNNSKKDIIFYDYFKEIEKIYSNFKLILILKETPLKWNGEQGILIQEKLQFLFNHHNIPLKNSNYYISGPLGMIKSSITFLEQKNVSVKNIFKETFFTEAPTNLNSNKNYNIKITSNGETSDVNVKSTESILDATLKAGINVSHSCRTGTCLSCVGKLKSGQVIIQNDSELSEIQKNKNYIVACQSFANSENIEINFDEEMNKSFLYSRNKIILASFLVFLFCAFLILKPETNTYLAKGEMNIGHEELECIQCHINAPGTSRQQIQRNLKNFLGEDVTKVDFGKIPVSNSTCLSCHDRPEDNHPVHRFNEPKFKKARDKIHPEKCLSCHKEHHKERVSFKETNYCVNCHKDVKIDNDPLDLKHKDLIDLEMWNTCLQCHDFHGNHIMELATLIEDTIPLEKIKKYFNDGTDPYGILKKYIVELDSIKTPNN